MYTSSIVCAQPVGIVYKINIFIISEENETPFVVILNRCKFNGVSNLKIINHIAKYEWTLAVDCSLIWTAIAPVSVSRLNLTEGTHKVQFSVQTLKAIWPGGRSCPLNWNYLFKLIKVRWLSSLVLQLMNNVISKPGNE